MEGASLSKHPAAAAVEKVAIEQQPPLPAGLRGGGAAPIMCRGPPTGGKEGQKGEGRGTREQPFLPLLLGRGEPSGTFNLCGNCTHFSDSRDNADGAEKKSLRVRGARWER